MRHDIAMRPASGGALGESMHGVRPRAKNGKPPDHGGRVMGEDRPGRLRFGCCANVQSVSPIRRQTRPSGGRCVRSWPHATKVTASGLPRQLPTVAAGPLNVAGQCEWGVGDAHPATMARERVYRQLSRRSARSTASITLVEERNPRTVVAPAGARPCADATDVRGCDRRARMRQTCADATDVRGCDRRARMRQTCADAVARACAQK